MSAGLLPGPKAIVQQVVLGLVVAVALAVILGHAPKLTAWMKSQGDPQA